MTPDPLAALAPGLTPYHYVRNNPINRIDPFGLTDEDIDDEEKIPFVGTTDPIVVFGERWEETSETGVGGGANNESEGSTIRTMNRNVVYNVVTTIHTSDHWSFPINSEGVGVHAKFTTTYIITIIEINGVYYAVIEGSGYTTASKMGQVVFSGWVSLLDGQQQLTCIIHKKSCFN